MPTKPNTKYQKLLNMYNRAKPGNLPPEAKDWMIRQLYEASLEDRLDLVGPRLSQERQSTETRETLRSQELESSSACRLQDHRAL